MSTVQRSPDRSNHFAYVANQPTRLVDPLGLAPGDKRFGLPDKFWDWYHRHYKNNDPDMSA